MSLSMMESAESFETNTHRKVDVRLLPFLFLCYTLAYLDRVNVGFAKLQMLNDLSLSDAAFATGAGIFFIGYFFFEVPSNVLLKKFGARTWIARIMISWGVLSTCMTFVKGEWSFHIMRFLLGIAEAGFLPGDHFLSHLVVSLQTPIHPDSLVCRGDCGCRNHRQSHLRLDHGSAIRRDELGGMTVTIPVRRRPLDSGRCLRVLLSEQRHWRSKMAYTGRTGTARK
jgi:hypothetical protein